MADLKTLVPAHLPTEDARALGARRDGLAPVSADDGGEVWALSLSGGGIRSATFCFGLLRGLASAGALHRFDYLSTVSGGGYIGAAFGRLFGAGQGAAEVQAGLASDRSLLLWWLRNNGRYLTPSGARDVLQAMAYGLRNLLFSLTEVLLLVLGAAGLMLLPYALMSVFGWNPYGASHPRAWPLAAGQAYVPVWVFIAVLPLLWGSHAIFAYWSCREKPSRLTTGADIVAALALPALGVLAAISVARHWPGCAQPPCADGAWHQALLAVQAVVAAVLLTVGTGGLEQRWRQAGANRAAWRLRMTQRLGHALAAVAACLLVAAFDYGSHVMADKVLAAFEGPKWFAAAAAALIAAARTLLPKLQGWIKEPPPWLPLPQLLNLLGLALLAALVLFGATLFQIAVSPRVEWTWPWAPAAGLGRWVLLFSAVALYLAFTHEDYPSLNLSSLHNFYRARIERAYVSTGNTGRFPAPGALGQASRTAIESLAPLVEAVGGDDVALQGYQPHTHGGPVHLVGCCVNQTVDDRTGLYNADRLGVALTVSALGVETGAHPPVPLDELRAGGDVGSLSRWIAVSGAAASSGMGSRTTPGLAALLFLSGLRLGYWTPNLAALKKEAEPLATKPGLLGAELLARFPGLGSPRWYVSDGGHFENTGVYALLKRRPRVIVVADCGADPKYAFEDLENLVRKAKIDYAATIRFVDPAALPAGLSAGAMALAQLAALPEAMKGPQGDHGLLLATIDYDRGAPGPAKGLLVIVKPRCLPGVGMEVSRYAQAHADFPQQTTADQFFDEAQWEAYHQLGLHVGAKLDPKLLAELAHRLA